MMGVAVATVLGQVVTALLAIWYIVHMRLIQNRFVRCKWFVEGDIKGFFDNIDHEVMIGILRKRIQDERFLKPVEKPVTTVGMSCWRFLLPPYGKSCWN